MTGKIFINYRRDDDPGFVHALFPRLEAAFGRDRLFMDVEGYIGAGDDFVEVLEGQVAECDVLLAVIGPKWLDAKDESGFRRLDSPNDFVRIEIVSALTQRKRVIPVLVNNAQVPRAESLPDDMKPLVRRNAVRLAHERFAADCAGLVKELAAALQKAAAARDTQLAAERQAGAAAAAREAASAERARLEAAERARLEEAERARREAAERVPRPREEGAGDAAGRGPERAGTEEIANWERVRNSSEPEDLRDHIARFQGELTGTDALARLEQIVWDKVAARPNISELQGFLSEFPASRFADQARDKIFALQVGGQTGPIRSQRDLVAAILFLVVGAAASWQGSALTMSTETGIGPGFLPRLVAAALIVLGLLSLIRAFTVRTLPIGDIAWRKVGATMAALALFAVLYQGAGLVAAVLACTLLSTAAAARFHWPTSIGVTALATVAAVLLVKALQLPAPLFGPWLGS